MAGYVRRTAVARGVLGESRFWLVVAILIYGRRLIRRFLGDTPKVVFSHELRPGETLLISHDRDAKLEA